MTNPPSQQDSAALVQEYPWDVYDLEFGQREEPAGFYLGLARKVGEPVLDLAARTGSVALQLAQAGFRVTAVERFQGALAQARAKAAGLPAEARSRLTLVQADPCRLTLEGRFRLAIIPRSGLVFLPTPVQQRAMLTCARAHLAEGGWLVLDMWLPRLSVLQEHEGTLRHLWTKVRPEDGAVVRRYHTTVHDSLRQQLHVRWVWEIECPGQPPERREAHFTLRYMLRFELEQMLGDCGYAILHQFGAYDERPFQEDSPRMVWVAARTE